jgi:hypothetical protein
MIDAAAFESPNEAIAKYSGKRVTAASAAFCRQAESHQQH